MGIFTILGSVASALFGGGSSGGNQALASQVINKILPETDKEKEAAALAKDASDISDEVSARNYQPADMPMIVYQPGIGLIPWFLTWMLDLISRLVDVVNHVIRPAGLIWIAGGLMHKWNLPKVAEVDPALWRVFLIMITFFYGGRTLVKDILPGVKNIIASWKGRE